MKKLLIIPISISILACSEAEILSLNCNGEYESGQYKYYKTEVNDEQKVVVIHHPKPRPNSYDDMKFEIKLNLTKNKISGGPASQIHDLCDTLKSDPKKNIKEFSKYKGNKVKKTKNDAYNIECFFSYNFRDKLEFLSASETGLIHKIKYKKLEEHFGVPEGYNLNFGAYSPNVLYHYYFRLNKTNYEYELQIHEENPFEKVVWIKSVGKCRF